METQPVALAISISAVAVDCIDTTGVGSDTKFTILVPTTAGGEHDSTATIIFLDADQTTNPVEGTNEIGIGINSVTDANIAALIIKAINGTSDSNIDFASSGVGASGVQGVTATQGSTTTKITLTISQGGEEGNLTNAITTTVAGDHDIVDLRTFSGGADLGGDDSYQTGSVKDNYYVQHQIPQSVMSYSWITASAESGPFGFEQPNRAHAGRASDDITFVSASHIGSMLNSNVRNFGFDRQDEETSARKDFQPSAFIPLNINFYNVLDIDSNTVTNSFPNGADLSPAFSEENGSYLGAINTATVATDCIDTTSVGSDTEFTILIPTTLGGESNSTATTIFLDADQTTNPVEGANKIAIGINSVTDANIAALIIKAINGTADNNIDFASSGVGASGVQGVTATQGSTTTKITLTIGQVGAAGNLINAITTTVAGDHDIVDLRTFSLSDTSIGAHGANAF